METRKKTRDLSVADYFIQIQKEYLIADFRRKIYYSLKDKAYYNRVIKYKAKRIEDIAKRNNLFSILNNPDTMERLRKTLFDDNGYPTFPMTPKDVSNYYSLHNSFSYNKEIYILEEIRDNRAVLSRDGETLTNIPKEKIYRIL